MEPNSLINKMRHELTQTTTPKTQDGRMRIITHIGNRVMKSDGKDSGLTHVAIIYPEYSTYNHTVNESQVLNTQGATTSSSYLQLNVIDRVKYNCNDTISIFR